MARQGLKWDVLEDFIIMQGKKDDGFHHCGNGWGVTFDNRTTVYLLMNWMWTVSERGVKGETTSFWKIELY